MGVKNIDDEFYIKKKSNIPFIMKIVAVILIIFALFFSISLLLSMGKDNSYEIETNGEKYGKSKFVKYQGQIYVPIPSGGMYVLSDVDIESFKPLNSGDYYSRIVGLDKNHVYFGNIQISDLDPNKLYYIGNGYYSDGINTYFCSAFSERNKDLSIIAEVIQMLVYSSSKNKKAQSYIYPYKKIKTDKKLRAVENLLSFATDGEKIYYQGEILENADLNTLMSVDGYSEYFVDKNNVYYKSKILPIKNTGKLKIVSGEQGNKFLYDEENGDVFIEDYAFDREKIPYKVLGNGGSHFYNLIFVAKDGIYYYDNQKKRQERAGDNIFIGDIKELTPDVFSDNENIYYFGAYEKIIHSKNGGEVVDSRNTVIYYLDKKVGWEKVKDINFGIVGSIWKKGESYYYFDNEGKSQLIYDTVYRVFDKSTLEYLLSDPRDINSEKIIELIENKKLISITGEEKLVITEKNKDFYRVILKYGRRFFLFIAMIAMFSKEIWKMSKRKK